MTRYVRYALFLVALTALAAGCGGSSKSSSSSTTTTTTSNSNNASVVGTGTYNNGTPAKGGTYKVGWEQSFGFTNNFDPTGEYLGNAWGLYSNLMLRSLIGYKHRPGADGNVLVGDLATTVSKPTNGGLTYTYTIRKGVKFSPPINRAVTSKDVAFAMQRLANPKDGGQYSFYYTVIKGWDDYANGKAKTITGIATPNNNTIVFTLTKPTGDFNLRMSMPATAPIPAEIGQCFEGKPGSYGRDVVSSGPYMLQGADNVSLAVLLAQADERLRRRQRQPHHPRPQPELRPVDRPVPRKNYPNEFSFTVDSNADDIFAKVRSGALDDEVSSPQPKTIREYETDPSIKPRLIPNVGDRTNYFTMNLTQPPFDDIHVRKAMNWITDKSALQKAWGGPIPGSIATHVVPPVLYANGLAEYDPYATPDEAGSVDKAAAEMKQSKYDPGKTGKCTASACKNVLMVADTRAVDTRMVPILQADAGKIGITFKVPLDQRRLHDDPGSVEERAVLRAPELGEGLRRPVHLLRRAVRLRRDHPVRQHELLARRPDAGDRQQGEGDREHQQHPDRRPGHHCLRGQAGTGPQLVLAEPRQEADDEGRPVGAVPLAEQRVHRRPERRPLELRPVHRRARVLVGGGEELTRATRGGGTLVPPPLERMA